MATIQDVRLPDIGGLTKPNVVEILVKPGEQISAGAPIVTLESDKSTLELPAPFAGLVTAVLVKLGDTVNTNDLLLRMAVDAVIDTAIPAPVAAASAKIAEATTPALSLSTNIPGEKPQAAPPLVANPPAERPRGIIIPHASPAVRRFARELGVDLLKVPGSGPKGRILQEDVRRSVQQALNQQHQTSAAMASLLQLTQPVTVDFSRFGPVVTKPLSRLRRLSGAHLHHCWLTIPHVTQFGVADITDLEAFRQQQNHTNAVNAQGTKLTLLPFVIKACATALRTMPVFNSAITADGDDLVMRQYVHIGVAVETINGLVVPVIRDADKRGITQLAQALHEASTKARAGTLTPADFQGGCFSISNLGGIGGTNFTPIINAPEAAILGISKAETRPTWNGQEFLPRLLLPLALSYDHRIIDGADGARFMTLLGQLLGDIRRLLL